MIVIFSVFGTNKYYTEITSKEQRTWSKEFSSLDFETEFTIWNHCRPIKTWGGNRKSIFLADIIQIFESRAWFSKIDLQRN
jgi:hypothetical protein